MTARGFDTDTELTELAIVAALAATPPFIAAGRYLRYRGGLTAAEIALCAKHGFGLWLIWEGMGDLATMQRGAARGKSDGVTAKLLAVTLGVPTTVPIFAAVDFDAAGHKK